MILIFFSAHWYLSLFTQSFFNHRYSAHKQFTMSKAWEKFWFVMSFIFQGSSYLSPNAYGIMHRLHHAYSDTEKDPHSPRFSENLFHMMWKTKKYYSAVFRRRKKVDKKFLKDLPEWRSFDLFGESVAARIIIGTIYVGVYAWVNPAWYWYLLLPVHFMMGPFHGLIINWFAHKIGYRNYNLDDTSRNLFPLDLLMIGEGLHNNHHKHSSNPNFGNKWWEFDPVYPFIRLFNWAGMIRLRK